VRNVSFLVVQLPADMNDSRHADVSPLSAAGGCFHGCCRYPSPAGVEQEVLVSVLSMAISAVAHLADVCCFYEVCVVQGLIGLH
jgi:hypothetical protein